MRHLRAGQIINRGWRHLHRPRTAHSPTPPLRNMPGTWVTPPAHSPEWSDAETVTILARTSQVRSAQDWRSAFDDDLRRYHLHYLDQLRAAHDPFTGFGASLIARWIAQNPPGSTPGWEPYPISRRLVNAIKAALRGRLCSPEALASLALQARHLLPRLEFHLLGNHLLANAKALLYAGMFFSGPEAERWRARGLALLRTQLAEQIGGDGGHFERTPMYHALVLEDLLDLVNLGRACGFEPLQELAEPCRRMLGWLAQMCHPDGDISFFNDATLGVALRYDELCRYAGALGLEMRSEDAGPFLYLKDSGYLRLRRQAWYLIADVGSVGPAYQPGHAHAQTLSCELSHRGERVIVNTGVSTYARDATRAYERGTAAHSTVAIDGIDSSEVWSSFRVGARARVTAFNGGEEGETVWASATHDGYRHSSYRALHTRCWRATDAGIEITDELTGRGVPAAQFALHLHPHCHARQESAVRVFIATPDGAQLFLHLDALVQWSLEPYQYAPAFGTLRPGQVIRGRIRAALPLRVRVLLSDSRASSR